MDTGCGDFGAHRAARRQLGGRRGGELGVDLLVFFVDRDVICLGYGVSFKVNIVNT